MNTLSRWYDSLTNWYDADNPRCEFCRTMMEDMDQLKSCKLPDGANVLPDILNIQNSWSKEHGIVIDSINSNGTDRMCLSMVFAHFDITRCVHEDCYGITNPLMQIFYRMYVRYKKMMKPLLLYFNNNKDTSTIGLFECSPGSDVCQTYSYVTMNPTPVDLAIAVHRLCNFINNKDTTVNMRMNITETVDDTLCTYLNFTSTDFINVDSIVKDKEIAKFMLDTNGKHLIKQPIILNWETQALIEMLAVSKLLSVF